MSDADRSQDFSFSSVFRSDSLLENEWALADEIMDKVTDDQPST